MLRDRWDGGSPPDRYLEFADGDPFGGLAAAAAVCLHSVSGFKISRLEEIAAELLVVIEPRWAAHLQEHTGAYAAGLREGGGPELRYLPADFTDQDVRHLLANWDAITGGAPHPFADPRELPAYVAISELEKCWATDSMKDVPPWVLLAVITLVEICKAARAFPRQDRNESDWVRIGQATSMAQWAASMQKMMNPDYSWHSGRSPQLDASPVAMDEAIKQAIKQHTSENARRAADKRNEKFRAYKAQVFKWLDANMRMFRSFDDAASAIFDRELVPVSWRTARDWVGEWDKGLRSARTA